MTLLQAAVIAVIYVLVLIALALVILVCERNSIFHHSIGQLIGFLAVIAPFVIYEFVVRRKK